MKVFGVQPSVTAPARILAATYAHNQLYYDQSDLQGSHRKRWAPAHAAQPHMRKAASGIASVLNAANKLKEAAAALREYWTYAAQSRTKMTLGAQDGQQLPEQLRQLLAAYNAALQSLDEAKPYLKQSVKRRLTDAANGYEIYGIHLSGDGTLELDEEKLKAHMNTHFEHVMNALAGNRGLAARLIRQAEQLEQEPASALLHPAFTLQSPLRTYQYQSQRGSTFQAGVLLDLVI